MDAKRPVYCRNLCVSFVGWSTSNKEDGPQNQANGPPEFLDQLWETITMPRVHVPVTAALRWNWFMDIPGSFPRNKLHVSDNGESHIQQIDLQFDLRLRL